MSDMYIAIPLAYGFSLMVMRFGLGKTVSLFGSFGMSICSGIALIMSIIRITSDIPEYGLLAVFIELSVILLITLICFSVFRRAVVSIVNEIYTR